MSKEVGAYIKSGAIFKSVKRVRELMKCELCFNELSQNRHLYTTHRNTIIRLRQRFQQTDWVADRRTPGRPRVTNPSSV